MNEVGKDLETVDDSRARPVEVCLPIHGIHVALAYGWHVIPAEQLAQRREGSAGLGQCGATGDDHQYLRGIGLQRRRLHHSRWYSWGTQDSGAPGELNQVQELIAGEYQLASSWYAEHRRQVSSQCLSQQAKVLCIELQRDVLVAGSFELGWWYHVTFWCGRLIQKGKQPTNLPKKTVVW